MENKKNILPKINKDFYFYLAIISIILGIILFPTKGYILSLIGTILGIIWIIKKRFSSKELFGFTITGIFISYLLSSGVISSSLKLGMLGDIIGILSFSTLVIGIIENRKELNKKKLLINK